MTVFPILSLCQKWQVYWRMCGLWTIWRPSIRYEQVWQFGYSQLHTWHHLNCTHEILSTAHMTSSQLVESHHFNGAYDIISTAHPLNCTHQILSTKQITPSQLHTWRSLNWTCHIPLVGRSTSSHLHPQNPLKLKSRHPPICTHDTIKCQHTIISILLTWCQFNYTYDILSSAHMTMAYSNCFHDIFATTLKTLSQLHPWHPHNCQHNIFSSLDMTWYQMQAWYPSNCTQDILSNEQMPS